MKTIDKIPTGKLGRASKILKTGIKVGGNFINYYGDKITKGNEQAKANLDKNNASDIYNGLSELKGSALKMAQMLSMEKNLIPQAYAEQFAQAQYSVPPISPPLVKRTFRKYFGENPEDIFESFDLNSYNSASMGQVHRAFLNDEELAVKIQYPGVAESITSDLKLVKPFALKLLNLKAKDSEKFFSEVEGKLQEETDYVLEVERSIWISNSCKEIPNLTFPTYYKEKSNAKIITMSWLHGVHLSEFIKSEDFKSQENRNKLGQTLWDFFMFQMHSLKMVHADPHPGNFIITKDLKLGVIDFGCIKEIPDDFYEPYFMLTQSDQVNNEEVFTKTLYELEMLKSTDTAAEKEFITKVFHDMLSLFAKPFNEDKFDFSSQNFFKQIADLGVKYADDDLLKSLGGNRGSEHLLYMNRTFFGLYNLLYELQAEISPYNFKKYLK